MEKYKLVKKIGQGSFGEVWLVKSSKTQKQYVLKQINLQHVSKREQRAAHLEVKLLSTLKHPNIVSYLDSFYNSKGSLFIVMGYCENGNLHRHIRNQNGIPFPEKQIAEWLVQICMALKYLHDKKILHRDLKTQNIYLTRNSLIKIGDLGIARVLDWTANMAATMAGTPYYMSPEIFCNKPYSFQSDVWALGCCMYEIATLKHAFYAGNFTSLMQRVLNSKIPEIQEHYTQEFHDMVLSMLSIDPDKRPSITDILLNSYVRSHIVVFLEETKSSSKLFPMKSPKPTSCEVQNYVSHDAVPKEMRFHQMQAPEQSIDTPGIFISKQHIFQTPDINGNGDGNDNSQQRHAVNNRRLSRNCVGSIKSASSEEFSTNETLPDLPLLPVQEMITHNGERSNISTSGSVDGLKADVMNSAGKVQNSGYLARRASKFARKNGQMSLNFLRNLTYTINSTPNYSLPKKNDTSSFWDHSNLPAISASVPGYSSVTQNTVGFDHFNSKRFKSSEQFQHKRTSESSRSIGTSVSSEMQLESATEQKENIACPQISVANLKKHQLNAYRGSKIPILSANAGKEVEDFCSSNTNKHFDPLFVSQCRVSLLRFDSEDCSKESSTIDCSLLQKIINCNIKTNTVPAHLNSAARIRRREKEDRNAKMFSAQSVSLDLKRTHNSEDCVGAESEMYCKQGGAKAFSKES